MTPDVLVIGGGPAGLTAASALRHAGVDHVLVLERETQAGGIPRHSDHLGYGIRDRRALVSGPAYARRLVDDARSAGVDLRTGAMVTDWTDDGGVRATTPDGLLDVRPRAVLLATGARERPRTARLVPGDRPAGVLTTGELQNLVHLQGAHVGERAVVVGSELVSWSAVLTLRDAGARTVLMTTERDRPEIGRSIGLIGGSLLKGPLATATRVARINGRDRVESVEIEHLATGRRRTIACDTVVFTGDWIPDHELARRAGLAMDPASRAPIVDTGLRTSRPGVFGAGNLLHPVATADVAALDGRHVAATIRRWLDDAASPVPGIAVRAEEPFRWVAPGVLRPGEAPPRGRLLLWPDVHRALPVIEVRQGAHLLARRRLPWPMDPGRIFTVPWSMCADAFGGGAGSTEDLVIGLA